MPLDIILHGQPVPDKKPISMVTMRQRTLLESNEEWAHIFATHNPGFFMRQGDGQHPEVLWLGCCDSRVPESVLLNVGPGVILSHRNLANQFISGDLSAEAVLQHAVEQVRVQHICVVGHTDCSGIEEAYDMVKRREGNQDGYIQRWLEPLGQLILQQNLEKLPKSKALPLATKENIKLQIQNLLKNKIVRKAEDEGRPIYLHGWLYNLETGKLEDLQISTSQSSQDPDVTANEELCGTTGGTTNCSAEYDTCEMTAILSS